ncbi:uncharacterized protein IAS62_002693 [Cryptococcus decagattii]|uniref:Uncharacterized protein n=1 Tax=Cryptococcus decagattii TaxID=1859122 RepID=A0ABZ2AS90_9TREE
MVSSYTPPQQPEYITECTMEWWAAAMEEVEGRCKEGRDDLSVLDVSVRRHVRWRLRRIPWLLRDVRPHVRSLWCAARCEFCG